MTEIAAPSLTREEIRERLEEVFASERRSYLVAMFGTGAADTIETRAAGRFVVIPTMHEAELREALPPLEEEAPRVVFLVPWALRLPLDVQGRFALGGRALQVGKLLRLRRMFNLPNRDDVIDPAVQKSALAEHLLQAAHRPELASSGGRLTLAELWGAFLRASFGVPTEGGLSLDRLLGWASLGGHGGGRGGSFGRALGGGSARDAGLAPPLREELGKMLEEWVGPSGPAVWRAWEEGRGAKALELSLVFEAIVRADEEGSIASDARIRALTWATMTLKHELGLKLGQEEAEQLTRELGRAAGGALRWVERVSGDALLGARLLSAAEEHVTDVVRPAVSASPRLASSWSARLSALGEALSTAAAEPSAEAVGAAREALRRLELHERFKAPDARETVERAEMALRLAAFLSAFRATRDKGAGASLSSLASFGELGRLARWYADEGGYVDWARRRARGEAVGAFGAGAAAVVTAADAVREELDRAFARALPFWVEAGRPATEVLPIDKAADRFVARFLAGKGEEEYAERRLLVVLLDGMAWAQAAELLDSLGAQPSPWHVVAWMNEPEVRVGQGLFPPVLAALPTLTETSRSAFFAGKPMEAGRTHGTGEDPARWAKHATVRALLDPHDARPVKLRAEATTDDGSADGDVLARIGDRSATGRLVTVVLNAIDSSLKADTQQRTRWTVDTVKALRPLLEAAQDAGRFVLLASDHGHVPADRLATVARPVGPGAIAGAGDEGGRRWRPLFSEGEALAEYEVALPVRESSSPVWAPRGAKGVVLIADDAHRYGSSTASGEHGGATLAEVVAPLVLVAPAVGHPAPEARALEVRPPPKPWFWEYLVEVTPAKAEAPPRAGTAPPRRKVSEAQLMLPALATAAPGIAALATASPAGAGPAAATPAAASPAAAPPAPAPTSTATPSDPSGWLAALGESAVFQVALKRYAGKDLGPEILRVLSLVVARDGRAKIAVLAGALGMPAFRMRSLASRITEVMNVEGYAVARLDGETLHIDKHLLMQVFEVPR